MILYQDLPRLDLDEARRFWLAPAEAIDVAGLWEELGDVRKLFANVVDRGHLPFRKTGTGRTTPRHFTLEAAIKFRVMWELVQRGRDYDCAGTVGDAVVALLPQAIEEAVRLADIEAASPWRVLIYQVVNGKTTTRVICPSWPDKSGQAFIRADDLFGLGYVEASAVDAGEFLVRCIRTYADHWLRRLYAERIAKGAQ
jgi:hypothetical protein